MNIFESSRFDRGGRIGAALGQGLGEGAQDVMAQRQMSQENRSIQEALASLNPEASSEDKMAAIQGLDIRPESKQQALRGIETLGAMQEREQTRALKSQELSLKEQAQASKEQQAANELEQQRSEGEILAKRQGGEPLTAEDWQKLSPTTRRALINAESQQPVFEKEGEKLAAKSAHAYYDQVQDEGRKANKQMAEVAIAKELNKKGVTGLQARNKLADVFGEWIRDPNAVEFRSRSKQFMEGIKELIGGRITEFEFKFFQNMFPNIDLSQAANESLLGMIDMREQSKKREQEVANQIVKKNGGRVPIDLKSKVDEKMEVYMDNQVKEWKTKAYKSMVKESPPPKGSVAVIDDNGVYRFLPKEQADKWQKSGRMVVGK